MLQVPKTCENFLILCKRGFYNGTGGWGGVEWDGEGCLHEGRFFTLLCTYMLKQRDTYLTSSCLGLHSPDSQLLCPVVTLLYNSPSSYVRCFPPSSLSLPPSPSPTLTLFLPVSPCSISPIHQEFHGKSVGMQETHTASVLVSDVTVLLILDTRGRPHWYW